MNARALLGSLNYFSNEDYKSYSIIDNEIKFVRMCIDDYKVVQIFHIIVENEENDLLKLYCGDCIEIIPGELYYYPKYKLLEVKQDHISKLAISYLKSLIADNIFKGSIEKYED